MDTVRQFLEKFRATIGPYLRDAWDWYSSLWQHGGRVEQAIYAVVVILFTLVALAVLVVILTSFMQMIARAFHRKPCHNCKQPTTRRSDGRFPECAAGVPCCENCGYDHIRASKPTLLCPVDQVTEMEMPVINGVVSYVCPECQFQGLDLPEREALGLVPAYEAESQSGSDDDSDGKRRKGKLSDIGFGDTVRG
jgi:hypothetical protein